LFLQLGKTENSQGVNLGTKFHLFILDSELPSNRQPWSLSAWNAGNSRGCRRSFCWRKQDCQGLCFIFCLYSCPHSCVVSRL